MTTNNASNLKQKALQANIKLDKLLDDLERSFIEVESNSLKKGMDAEEVEAFRFLQGIVAAHNGTITEVKEIFTLCISAHEEYQEPMRFYRMIKIIASGKFVLITVLVSIVIAAYKIFSGDL